MRVPLSWLREYVDIDLTPEQLAERLTMLGMEVAGIERIGDDWRSVVVGELLGVVVLDVDVKPNRGDALSIVGLAREVAAATGAELRWPDIHVGESGDATDDHLHVSVEDPRCSVFVGRYLDGVTVGPSPIDI